MDDNTINKTNESTIEDKPLKEKKLTKRDELFCLAYVNNLCNGSKAWIETHPGCQPSTARREAQRKMTNPLVRAYIEQLQEELKSQYKLSASQILQEQIENYDRMKRGTKKVIYSSLGDAYEYTDYNDRAINEALMNITKLAGLDKPQQQEVKIIGPDPVHVELLEALKDVKIEGVDDVDGDTETNTDISSSS